MNMTGLLLARTANNERVRNEENEIACYRLLAEFYKDKKEFENALALAKNTFDPLDFTQWLLHYLLSYGFAFFVLFVRSLEWRYL